MITLLTLAVLSQHPNLIPEPSAPELVVASAAVESPKGQSWQIVTPILGGLGLGLAGRRFALELTRDSRSQPWSVGGAPAEYQLLGFAVGTVLGLGLGYFAGQLAQEGSVLAKVAAVTLYVVMGAAVYTELGSMVVDAKYTLDHMTFSGWGSSYW